MRATRNIRIHLLCLCAFGSVWGAAACADPAREPPAEGEGEGEFVLEPGGDVSGHIGEPDGDEFDVTVPAAGEGTCSSGQWWQRGDHESENMHPGRACIDCHTREDEGPDLVYAGTVHQALDDADDCRGVSGILIDIIDDASDEVVASAITNDGGNFLFEAGDVAFTRPYRVSMFLDGRTREMLTPQTDGDCMKCHTSAGLEGAPGRIVAP